MSHILVIDTGSSSMRGILFSENGSMDLTEQYSYSMKISGDAAEYDPKDFEDCLISVCKAAVSWCQEHQASVDALSFTSQRSSILPVTSEGRPLGMFMTWYDKRAADICKEMNQEYGRMLYLRAGMKASPVLSAPKMKWLKKERPDIYHKADKIIGIQDYLIYLCTGRFVTDTTLASRTHLMNIDTRGWDRDLLTLYGIDKEKLADLTDPASIVGKFSGTFSHITGIRQGTPVITAGGAQQVSVLGQGLLKTGDIGLTCGSGAYLAMVTDEPLLDEEMRVNVSTAVSPGQWVMEASTLSSGTVQDWMERLFYKREEEKDPSVRLLHEEAAGSPAGARGLIMLPDLAGKGCPDWNDEAKGAFLNVKFEHTRPDFARAMLEGLVSEMAECYAVLTDLMQGSALKKGISVTGGLTRSSLFTQMTADMLNCPVHQCTNYETTAYGAFLAADYALGRHASLLEAWKAKERTLAFRTFEPDKAAVQVYREINAKRRKFYEALSACPC